MSSASCTTEQDAAAFPAIRQDGRFARARERRSAKAPAAQALNPRDLLAPCVVHSGQAQRTCPCGNGYVRYAEPSTTGISTLRKTS